VNGLLALAVTAGMLAPVNPCGIALLPAWITHSLGDGTDAPVSVRLARAARAGVALALGFAGTLAAAGLAVSAGVRALITAAPWLGLATGIALALLGVAMLTGRSLGPHLRLPTTDLRPGHRPASMPRLALFGVAYAVASLSCTFGVLLAVIAQAQATASYGGLLAVFAAYAAGAGALLLLVSITNAAAGAAAARHLTVLARYGSRITGVVLTVTGAYLTWYWYPAATGHGTGTNVLVGFSAAASSWLQTHTGIVLALAVAAVLGVIVAALRHRLTAACRAEPHPDPAEHHATATKDR
jgi:cytochrome c-type biogenesis protein